MCPGPSKVTYYEISCVFDLAMNAWVDYLKGVIPAYHMQVLLKMSGNFKDSCFTRKVKVCLWWPKEEGDKATREELAGQSPNGNMSLDVVIQILPKAFIHVRDAMNHAASVIEQANPSIVGKTENSRKYSTWDADMTSEQLLTALSIDTTARGGAKEPDIGRVKDERPWTRSLTLAVPSKTNSTSTALPTPAHRLGQNITKYRGEKGQSAARTASQSLTSNKGLDVANTRERAATDAPTGDTGDTGKRPRPHD
ncbi:uncharacterized protein GLRG_08928 [Colletotrichum graminicola M1.001]|uniref:Uncharacterized protein n=1 Tax=Colletotrichum graminicola (strain M1.001 / M2 / FGSC 10212) TaxID=645133 RepID=E3QSF7_COLGM|nr:uncharacterized protein GLRG_08928 [Colletotrichum graminicola M1.001]EFQ33784.1 hypothetical protein GLRG_08928 [Colletotrichum graminicola M1.001]